MTIKDMKKNNIKYIILGICVLLNLVVLFSLVYGENSFGSLTESRQHLKKVKKEVVQTEERNLFLSEEIRLLQSGKQYIEKTIREKLNYTKPGEIIYTFERERTPTL